MCYGAGAGSGSPIHCAPMVPESSARCGSSVLSHQTLTSPWLTTGRVIRGEGVRRARKFPAVDRITSQGGQILQLVVDPAEDVLFAHDLPEFAGTGGALTARHRQCLVEGIGGSPGIGWRGAEGGSSEELEGARFP